MKARSITKVRRKYDANFRDEVIKMVLNGCPVREVSQSLGIGENLIYKWKSRHSGLSTPSSLENAPTTPVSISITDYERLKAKLREVEQERDILKKALGIFSRGT